MYALLLSTLNILTERNNCEANNPCRNDGICVNYPEEDGAIYCDCTETNYIWEFCQGKLLPFRLHFVLYTYYYAPLV